MFYQSQTDAHLRLRQDREDGQATVCGDNGYDLVGGEEHTSLEPGSRRARVIYEQIEREQLGGLAQLVKYVLLLFKRPVGVISQATADGDCREQPQAATY